MKKKYLFTLVLIMLMIPSTLVANESTTGSSILSRILSVWNKPNEMEEIALKDIGFLQSCLLNPDSLILYNVYVNQDYSGAPATTIYFGAQNKVGGITDDWAFIQNESIQLESKFDQAEKSGDTKSLKKNGDIVFIKLKIQSGSKDWVSCDAEKLRDYLN